MAIAKTSFSLLASTSVGAAAPINAAEWDMSALFSGIVVGKIVNGASAPVATAPIVVFFGGESTGVKREIWRMGGDLAVTSTTPVVFRVPKEIKFLNVTVTGGGTNGSTFELMGLGFTGP